MRQVASHLLRARQHRINRWLICLVAVLLPSAVFAVDLPHSTNRVEVCGSCHLTHAAPGDLLLAQDGDVKLCQSCHIPGGMAATHALVSADQAKPAPGLPPGMTPSGTSHRWDSSASGRVEYVGGAVIPSTGTIQSGGTNSGPYPQTYTLAITTTGQVGVARFNWTNTTPGGGYATNLIGGFGNNLLTGTNVALTNGVKVTFTSGTNKVFQVNDRWRIYVRPALRNPTNAALLANLPGGVMMCSTCHDSHKQVNTPFDPTAPAYTTNGSGAGRHYQAMTNSADQMCLDCHAARSVTNSALGSHPVNVLITTNAYYKNPVSLPLSKPDRRVLCETCHKVHFSPETDGSLARMTNRLAACTDCHTLGDTASPARHLNAATAVLWPGGRTNCSTFPAITDTTLRGACENCHQAHGWPSKTNTSVAFPKLLVDQEENLCFTCHGTNGPAATKVEADFAKTYRHPVNDAQQVPGRVVDCGDCHNPHRALAGSHPYATTATSTRNLASNPLKGVEGVSFSYTGLTNFQTVASNRFTAIAKIPGATYEYQICFKCHTSYSFGTTPPPGVTPTYSTGTATFTFNSATVTGSGTSWNAGMVGAWIVRSSETWKPYKITAVANTISLTISPAYTGTTASGQSYRITLETDVAREFSPMNKSGHPIVTGLDNYPNSTVISGKRGLLAAAMKAPWNVNVGTQTMMCSDCHNTDAATPAAQGPHGSASQFMLRGTNPSNWPAVANTSAGFTSSWCANCHNNSSSIYHGDNHTGYSCYACHIVIPHGGKVSRLLGANGGGLPARYAYNNSTSTMRLTGVTKSTATGYGSGSCGGCSEHSSGSEKW